MHGRAVIIRAAALRPRPWPNGLGTTRDVAEGEGWLISIADLGGEAAFSHFGGTDRVFTLIGGAGATLTLDGETQIPCRPFVPACFPGDRPAHYRPGGGPARAFNVFAERARCAPWVAVQSVAAGHGLEVAEATTAVHCAEGVLEAGDARLEAGDTILHPGATRFRAAGGAALAILVALRPASQGG
ncbi:HutD family protein [Roseomonas sp. SSH11]|uniref:HutD family protein n=1 Tax=Pararoseomonas baculiformis TaxID=2820812 RepID=A0ABS4A8S8_9PROT|nr:HutD family protein [Pararoseomonas baculiformis]MBP0443402.1 HutD family protein [Pararoseomonas baculiformis]